MRLSLIIASCRRPDSLARLIKSLAPQLDDDTEILIAENGSAQQSEIARVEGRIIHLYERGARQVPGAESRYRAGARRNPRLYR